MVIKVFQGIVLLDVVHGVHQFSVHPLIAELNPIEYFYPAVLVILPGEIVIRKGSNQHLFTVFVNVFVHLVV